MPGSKDAVHIDILESKKEKRIKQAEELKNQGREKKAATKYLEAADAEYKLQEETQTRSVDELLMKAEELDPGTTVTPETRSKHAGEKTGSTDKFTFTAPSRSFEDVAGMTQLKQELKKKAVKPFRHREKYQDYGLNPVTGVLLHGPPGTGKTWISEALAGELQHNYIRVTPSELGSKYVNEGSENIAALFTQARRNTPCTVFIDEVDGVAPRRSGNLTNSERQGVNQLLTELTESQEEDILVIAATNHLQLVDQAVRQSHRFQEIIEVGLPDRDTRKAIMEYHLKDRPIQDTSLWNWNRILEETENYNAGQLKQVVNEAALGALEEDSLITEQHVNIAIQQS